MATNETCYTMVEATVTQYEEIDSADLESPTLRELHTWVTTTVTDLCHIEVATTDNTARGCTQAWN